MMLDAMDGHADVVSLSTRWARPQSLTQRWFGLDWTEHLPWQVCGVTVDVGDFAEILPSIQRLYPALYGRAATDDRFLPDPMRPAKFRFYQEADVFVFRDADEMIGLQVAHPTDWSSYYVRTVALLPQYRGRGIVAAITRRMSELLARVGVERIEGDIPPPNIPNVIAQTKLGYVATGMLNTDRWGAMTRLTKYISDGADSVFRDRFCYGTWPRCRDM